MKNMTLAHITEVCGGIYFGPEEKKTAEVTDIVTDSRKAGEGSLFVAIPGERVDGHKFIPNVASQGALAVISEQKLETPPCPYILVKDSMEAIKAMAEYYMQQLNIPVVGITGSVGKTSTKETIASVLAQKYRVLKTDANFNNELGLSLTVFRLREEDEMAVLEMGIDDFGQMHRLAKIARPETAVITNIGWCHLENLKTRDGILQAKTEIFDHLRENGHIIINGDDDKLSTVGTVHGIKPVHFGLDEKNEYYADEIESLGLSGIACTIHADGESIRVTVPIPGWHMVLNALAATAVGRALGLTMQEIKAGIEALEPVGGRFHIINHGDIQIIDDCYNANPVSMKASLDVLRDAKGRKVAILGDMGELGENEEQMHAEVGYHAAKNKIDLLICTGKISSHMAEAAMASGGCGEVLQVPTMEALLTCLPSLIQSGDTVLVKASHFMHFEKVVEKLQEI